MALRHSPQTKVCGVLTRCLRLIHIHAGHVAVSLLAPSDMGATGTRVVASYSCEGGSGRGVSGASQDDILTFIQLRSSSLIP